MVSVNFARFLGLTSLIDSTIAFTTAFGLEVLLFSSEMWTKVPVGVTLALMVLLISWCVWTALEAKKDISILGGVHSLKESLVELTRGLRGRTSEPGPDIGDNGGQDSGGTLNGRWRLRRPRASTLSALVNPRIKRLFGQGRTTVEMNEMNDEGTQSAA